MIIKQVNGQRYIGDPFMTNISVLGCVGVNSNRSKVL